MGRDAAPSSGTPVAVEPPTPPRSSRTLRASPSRPRSYVPGGSARLGSAAAARLLGRETAEAAQAGRARSPAPAPTERRPCGRSGRVRAGPGPHRDKGLERAFRSARSARLVRAAVARRSPPRAYRAGR